MTTRITCDLCGAEIPRQAGLSGPALPRSYYRLVFPDGKALDLCDYHGQVAAEAAAHANRKPDPKPIA